MTRLQDTYQNEAIPAMMERFEYGNVLAVLGEGEHLPPVHQSVPGDHGVAKELAVGKTEIGGPVGDEGVQFLKGALVHQQDQPLPRR